MKNTQPTRTAGLFIDHSHALIITTNPSDETLHINERIEGPSAFTSDSEHARNNAKQGDLLKYYKSVAEKLFDYDSILIFGSGKAQEEFNNHLSGNSRFKEKTIKIEATDKLTDNQKVAFVKKYFEKHSSDAAVES